MNREEAIKLLKDTIERLSAPNGYLWPDERKVLLDAFTALRGPVPDPKTGLVPCGCGGSAVLDGAYGDDEVESSYRTEIYCEQCLTRTPIYTEDEQAKAAWNRAMGWKGGAE